MRIAIDATELEGRPTGVGRYLANLLRSWQAMSGDERFILYHQNEVAFDPEENERVSLRQVPAGRIGAGWYHQQVNLAAALNADRPDLLFAPAYTLPLRWHGPSLLTVHDLSFEAHPEWFGGLHGMRMRWLTRRSCRRASLVLAVSEFTRGEIIRRYGTAEDKVVTVLHGMDDRLLRTEATPERMLRERLALPGPFVLMVGSLFERRFPLRVISAFRRLGDLGLSLVIAGEDRRKQRSDLEQEIERIGVSGRVRWLRYCPEADLAGLYHCASALIYLSEYEGFGLPPLEGMLFGVPAIVSGRGALREVYEGAAAFVGAENEMEIADVIRRVFSDGGYRGSLVRAGTLLVERLSLRACAERTLALLHAAVES